MALTRQDAIAILIRGSNELLGPPRSTAHSKSCRSSTSKDDLVPWVSAKPLGMLPDGAQGMLQLISFYHAASVRIQPQPDTDAFHGSAMRAISSR